MEKPAAKFFSILFILSAMVWMYTSSMKNYESGHLLKFATIEFEENLNPVIERASYRAIAEYSVMIFISYPIVIFSAIGFVATSQRTFKEHGWLLMSALLLLMFLPVEVYCYWLDWKIVGLNYWGDWPLDEFRKAMIARLTALAGLPFIAQLCYYTIPIIIIFKPLQKSEA